MIIVILSACILAIMLGIYGKIKDFLECDTADGFVILGVAGTVISGIALLIVTALYLDTTTVAAKVAMLEQQNERVVERIDNLIADHREHEKLLFSGSDLTAIKAAVNLFPDSKSAELVKPLIDIYDGNVKQIRELRLQELTAPVYRWWLYFGK